MPFWIVVRLSGICASSRFKETAEKWPEINVWLFSALRLPICLDACTIPFRIYRSPLQVHTYFICTPFIRNPCYYVVFVDCHYYWCGYWCLGCALCSPVPIRILCASLLFTVRIKPTNTSHKYDKCKPNERTSSVCDQIYAVHWNASSSFLFESLTTIPITAIRIIISGGRCVWLGPTHKCIFQ